MDKAKKFFANLRDAPSSTREPLEVHETLSSQDFTLSKVVRHGFPHEPTCMAYDAVQRLLGIGTKHGSIRIFGKAGVDYHLKHESEQAVLQLQFLVNEGALISACKDDCIHLWNFRQKRPEIVHSLQFQREGITYIHLPFQSKWLYVGTDKGNVHVVSIQNFTLSGYVVNWNKAIDISQKNHPGYVKHLSDCVLDENKLLIGFEKGTVVLWDLKSRQADARWQCEQYLRSISWHYEGKQFICAQQDGSLCIWSPKKPTEPVQIWAPHARKNDRQNSEQPNSNAVATPRERCRPITQVEWRHNRAGDEFLIFAGGLPQDESGVLPAVTVLRGGKSATVLEMEHPIVSFHTLCDSPFLNDTQEPFAVAVLLKTDFLIVDLTTPGYPCFENPYPMDIHESPVTCCTYLADCPTDLIAAYYSVGSKQKRQKCSDKSWPITGGEARQSASGNTEMIITGHADGSLKFWDATSDNLQVLYKLKSGRHFERPAEQLSRDFNALAVTDVCICPQSRCLAVAGQAAQVSFFRFVRQEVATEIPVLEVPIISKTSHESKSTAVADSRNRSSTADLQRQASVSSVLSSASSEPELFYPLKVRPGPFKRPAGYQPEMVCLTPWHDPTNPESIRVLALNTAYGLLAYGTEQGVAVIDVVQHTPVFVSSTMDLYVSAEPSASRLPKAQLSNASDSSNHEQRVGESEETLSPMVENRELPDDQQLTQMFQLCGSSVGSSQQQLDTSDLDELSPLNFAETPLSAGPSSTPVSFSFDLDKNHNQPTPPGINRATSVQEPRRPPRRKDKAKVQFATGRQKSKDDSDKPKPKPSLVRLSSLPLSDDDDVKKQRPPLTPPVFSTRKTQSMLDSNDRFGNKVPDRARLASPKRSQSVKTNPMKEVMRRISSRKSTSTNGTQEESRRKAKLAGGERAKSQGASPFSLRRPLLKAQTVPDATEPSGLATAAASAHAEKECRSRSSSVSSQDNVLNTEAVCSLAFIESCSKRNDTSLGPCLWMGTSQGCCLVLNLFVPSESRLEQAVLAAPSGSVFRVKGHVLAYGFLDSDFWLLAPPADSWKDTNKDSERLFKNKVMKSGKRRVTPTTSSSLSAPEGGGAAQPDDVQYCALVGERVTRVMGLPSQCTHFSARHEPPLAKAKVIPVLGAPAVLALAVNGFVTVHSLPSLRLLVNAKLLNSVNSGIVQTLCLSDHGHGCYMCSPSEVYKFTVSAEVASQLSEVAGDLFQGCDMPEAPKQGFFKGLFTGNNASLDREELFGESSGKASKTVATHIPGPNAIDPLRATANNTSGAAGRTVMALHERGEKLSEVEDRTAMMAENAKAYQGHASDLVRTMKNKKWYQL